MSKTTPSHSAHQSATTRSLHLGDALEDLRTTQRAFLAFEELLQPETMVSGPEASPTSRENLFALLSVLNARFGADLAAAFTASKTAPSVPASLS